METGIVTLDENTVAPAVVVAETLERVTLWVFLPTGPIRYDATRGDTPAVGVFITDSAG